MRDLRTVPLAVAAWVAAWLATAGATATWWGLGGAAVVAGVVAGFRRSWRWLAVALVLVGVGASAGLAAHRLTTGPVAELADRSAFVEAVIVPRTDLQVHTGGGPRGDYATARAVLVQVSARDSSLRVRQPVLIIVTGRGLHGWESAPVGSRLSVRGELVAPDAGDDVGAILRLRSPPELISRPSPPMRVVERIRQGLRDSVAQRRAEPRALVPALVLGDTSAMTTELTEDFRATGLTHLTAVSGANLTLLLAFLLTAARWCGVRGWWLRGLGLFGVIIFVVLCRSEPSVLRAAAMGLVALAALGSGARRAGLRNLSVAALGLLLLDPFLSRSLGFALSVLASAGIVWWAGPWATALQRWTPRLVAEAVAVPLAAQLATQPVVTAIAGQISVSGLLANALAGPLVGPATVLGFAAAGLSVMSPVLAAAAGFGAAWAAQVIIWIAGFGAALPGSSIQWPVSMPALVWLTVGSLVLVVAMPRILASRWVSLAAAGVVVLGLAVVPRQPGWPPPDWLLVGCDVGQGDGLVVAVGDRAAIVVDTGPDPRSMEHCLAELGIRSVPLLILSHFHADHVDGLNGLGSRPIGQIWVSPLVEPDYEVARVRTWAGEHQALVSSPPAGTVAGVGEAEVRVVGPVPHGVDGDESSVQNDESLVVMITVDGTRLLLTGDVEPPGQQAILRSGAVLTADVLKVPHHGSSRQEPDFFAATGARLAVVSAALDNDYGHPAPKTVQLAARLGMTLLRTDQQGSVAVSRDRQGRLTATVQRQPGGEITR